MRRAPVEMFPLPAPQDRSFDPLTNRQVDRANRAWDEGDDSRLVALPNDPEGAVASLEPEVFDVGGARFTHPQAVQTEEGGKSKKVAQGEATRRALITAARVLFGSQGYADTSLDEIVQAGGVSKGALYHHFSGKEDLFRAVFRSVKEELSRVVVEAQMDPDPWTSLLGGCRTFIEAHTDRGVQRIVLLDARAVLSWEAWHDVDSQFGTVIIRSALRRAINHGIIVPLPLSSLATILSGALTEACMLVANADDPTAARVEAIQILERLLQGLRCPPDP